MTKKIFLGMSAMAMLFATSCKDDFAESFVGDQATVEFSISTPEIGTRAYSNGMTATKLQYAVYEKNGDELTYLKGLTVTNETINKSKSVSLELTTGESYAVIFWAAAPNAPYTVDFEDMEMTVDYTNAVSNDESRDAFYKYHEFTVSGAQTETIELRRPFAQLNIGTSDYAAATATNYNPTQSKVTVKKIYNTLNLASGDVSGNVAVTFDYNAIPGKVDNVDAETFPVAGYDYLAMNYLLVPADQEVVDIEFGYKGASDAEHTRTVGSVPVRRNYRTNIYGKLLTSTVDVKVEIKPEYNDVEYNISTADELQEAIYDAVAEGHGTITLTDDIIANEIITIGTNTRSNAGTQNARIVINGNGKTLTSTAGRAINVSGVNGVTIQNLTIDAKGERAINIIQNATDVTIEKVTATAANYTVNVAASAPYAEVAIKNSTLNGLCTVNVSAAGADVTVDGSTINCNDNNDTAGESYAALCLNKAAVGGKIIATNTTVNVTEGSDSEKGRNGAEDGVVTINGSTEGVTVTVAAITYPGSDYYYGFQTLQAAIDFAKAGDTITLIRDITTSETYTIEGKNITLDLNGKTIVGTMHKGVGAVIKVDNGATLKVIGGTDGTGGTISSTAENGGSAIENKGTLEIENVTLNGAPNANGSWPAYTVNNTGTMTAKNVKITSYHGAVASYGNVAEATLNDCIIDMTGIPGFTSHGIYTYNGGKVVVNDGTYANKATDQNASGASVINGAVEVNAGIFTGRIENYYGTPVLKGGTYTVKPNDKFIAEGHAATQNADGTWTVK